MSATRNYFTSRSYPYEQGAEVNQAGRRQKQSMTILGKMVKTAYLVVFVGVAFVLLGIVGEISGLRALVCSRNDGDFAHKAILVAGFYLVASLVIASVLIHLLNPYMAGRW